MILGIMQPYFFPYLGYFDLINYADYWIVFDTAQYIRHGWVNRNRILHPDSGWLYITAPVKASLTDPINEVQVVKDDKWKRKILGQMQHYKKKAYDRYEETFALVQDCLDTKESSISLINVRILERVCNYMGIPFNYAIYSQMDLNLGPIEGPGDWALRISEALGANEYVNPPGGEKLFDRGSFLDSGIELTIRHLPPMEYKTRRANFLPNLSIVDVLMWNEPDEVKKYLDDHR